MKCDAPNDSLYTFVGNLIYQEQSGETTLPIGPSSLLLRGSSLRNTEWVVGLVIYAGHDSKASPTAFCTP